MILQGQGKKPVRSGTGGRRHSRAMASIFNAEIVRSDENLSVI